MSSNSDDGTGGSGQRSGRRKIGSQPEQQSHQGWQQQQQQGHQQQQYFQTQQYEATDPDVVPSSTTTSPSAEIEESHTADSGRMTETTHTPGSTSATAPTSARPSTEFASSSASKQLGGGESNLTTIALKILVSNNVAGSIIGRAGQTISELQNQSKCRIKLSQTRDCFPGTSDRVCLLQGEMSSVQLAVRMILEKFWQQQQQQHAQQGSIVHESTSEDYSASSRSATASDSSSSSSLLTIRLLVPSAACGMLIGRGGSHIKSIAEKSHARIQLAQKEEMASVATSERIVTITGDIRACMSCVASVLEGMASHPDIYKYSNMTTSYSKAVAASAFGQAAAAAAAAASAAMSPHQSPSSPMIVSPHQLLQSQQQPIATGTSYAIQGTSEEEVIQTQKQPLSSSVSATTPSTTAFGHPSQHINRQAGTTIPPSFLMEYTTKTSATADKPKSITSASTAVSSPEDSTRSETATVVTEGSQQKPSQQQQQQGGGMTTLQLAVPDSLIGGILGRGGAGIAELQICSGARIKVSDRGEFVPGTTNRIVVITGTGQSCATAHFLISQRMAQQMIQPTGGETSQQHRPQHQRRRRRQPQQQQHSRGDGGKDHPCGEGGDSGEDEDHE